MHTRQTTFQLEPSKVDEFIRGMREEVFPTIREHGGRGARCLVDRGSGKVLAISLWESAAALQAAEGAMNRHREQFLQRLGAVGVTSEVFEVAINEDF